LVIQERQGPKVFRASSVLQDQLALKAFKVRLVPKVFKVLSVFKVV
jgi:hypothetical protein